MSDISTPEAARPDVPTPRTTNNVWGSIPANERYAWSNAFIDNPPTIPNIVARWSFQGERYREGTVSLDSWVKVARHFHDLGLSASDWLLLKDVLAPIEPDPWGDRSPEERRAWSAATLVYRPHFTGATVTALMERQVRRTGVNICEPWISFALEFRAEDFTAEEFLLLNELVWAFASEVPGVNDSELVPYKNDLEGGRRFQLRAADWRSWLLRYRGGADPAALMAAIVAPKHDFARFGDPRRRMNRPPMSKYVPEN